MKNFIKFFIALLVGASLFYFVVRETGTQSVWEAVFLFFGVEGVVILGITILIVFVGALRWQRILYSEGESVPFFTVLSYLIKGFTVDFLTPFSLFGGEAVRIFLIEKEVGIRKGSFSAITDKILDITAHFFFLLLGVLLFLFYSDFVHKVLFIYALSVVIFLFFLLFLFYEKALRRKSFLKGFFDFFKIKKRFFDDSANGKIISDVEEKVVIFFSEKRRELLIGLGLSFLRHFLLVIRVLFIFYFIVGIFDIRAAVVSYGFVILSMILPLPASLGGLEAILALTFGSIGVVVASGVVVAITLRGADLFVCMFGIVLFIRLSIKSFYSQFKLFLKGFSE